MGKGVALLDAEFHGICARGRPILRRLNFSPHSSFRHQKRVIHVSVAVHYSPCLKSLCQYARFPFPDKAKAFSAQNLEISCSRSRWRYDGH
jgi:hypothetical protein